MSENNEELYHHGVLGMKWGHRKAVPMSSGQARVARAKAAYKAANKQYSKDFNRASSYSSRHLISQYFGKNKKTSNDNWGKAYDSATAANKAKKAYKQAKTNLKRSNVKNYSKQYNKASSMSDRADAEFAKAKEMRKKIGKNAVSRVLASMRNKSVEAKAYNKQFEKASNLADKADAQWAKSKELYKKTGRTRVGRVINNIKYRK